MFSWSQFTPELWPCHSKSQIITFDKVHSYSLKSYCKSVENSKALQNVACQNVSDTSPFNAKKDTIAQRTLGIIPGKCTPFGGANGKGGLFDTICEGAEPVSFLLPNVTSCYLIVVCVTLEWNWWQPSVYLVPMSVGLLTTRAYFSIWYYALVASER